VNIGIDIESVKRFYSCKKGDTFINRIFTKQEQGYCFLKSKPAIHLAGLYCAKEALRKTLHKKYVELHTIEVRHAKSGKPIIKYEKNKSKYIVSISHTKDLAIAIVIRK